MEGIENHDENRKSPATKADIAELQDYLTRLLEYDNKTESRRDETARALISIYDNLTQRYIWLNNALNEDGLAKKRVVLSYKQELMKSFVALAKEVLALLEQYGVKLFRDAGKFDGRRHQIVYTKPTLSPEKHGRIAEVKRRGFVKQTDEDEVVFRPQRVVVYRYEGT